MATSVSGAPSRLASAALSLSSLRNDAYQEFIAILDRLPPGKTLLVVDPKLVSPMKLVVTEGSKILREHRVESIVELATTSISTSCENVLYLTRPSFQLVKLVAAQVKGMLAAGATPNLHLFFVPRRTFVCEQMLKDEGVFADLTISEFGLEMVALDDDVLSLCMDSAFADVEVQGDTTALFLLAQALIKLQVRRRSQGFLACYVGMYQALLCEFTPKKQERYASLPARKRSATSHECMPRVTSPRRWYRCSRSRAGKSTGPPSLPILLPTLPPHLSCSLGLKAARDLPRLQLRAAMPRFLTPRVAW
jgi:hypothetical protein